MPRKRNLNGKKKNRISHVKEHIAFGCIVVGFFLVLISTIYFLKQQSSLWFAQIPKNQSRLSQTNDKKQPIRLEIPSLAISLPVTDAYIVNRNWEVSRNGVSHLSFSANPRTNGNIILYGHNKSSILGPITRLKKGDILTVTTNDRSVYSYVVKNTEIVSPNNTHILESDGKEKLTLYTCTGFADMKRFVVKAVPL